VQCIANQAINLIIPAVLVVFFDRFNNTVTKQDLKKLRYDLINQLKNTEDFNLTNDITDKEEKKQEVIQGYDEIIYRLTICSIVLYLFSNQSNNLSSSDKFLNTSLKITSCILIWATFIRFLHVEYLSNIIKNAKNIT
jgi:anaerobic C4-dicarboxylate transporter